MRNRPGGFTRRPLLVCGWKVEEGVRGLCSCEVNLICGEFEEGGIVQGTVEVVELLALKSFLGAT